MQESNQKSNQKILSAIRENPSITIQDMMRLTQLSESGVKKILRTMRNNGTIERKGGDKGGHWEVVKNV